MAMYFDLLSKCKNDFKFQMVLHEHDIMMGSVKLSLNQSYKIVGENNGTLLSCSASYYEFHAKFQISVNRFDINT